MAIDKTPKLCGLAAFGVGGWLLPLAFNLSPAIEGFSLALATFSSTALALTSSRETIVSGIAHQERKMGLERIAYEMTLSHEAELAKLRSIYGFEDDLDDRLDDESPRLTGGHIGQPTIAGGKDETIEHGGNDRLWTIDRLLQNNSSHVLLIGQTGSGKTTLARWLIGQLQADQVIVLDADDDGQTWNPYPTIGAGDNWVEIEAAMITGLDDFSARKPNDRSLPQTVFILEELPDLVAECKTGVDFCSRILRRGRKRKQFVIGLTQDPNSGAIGLSQPVQKCFTRIYLGGMGRYALKNLVPRGDRANVAAALEGCTRPAIVEFLGEWFAWDVPDLSPATISPPTPIAMEQSETGTIATLERTLSAPPIEATMSHWAVVDLSVAMPDQWLSVRETMRRIPALKTADEVKQMFRDLVSLELGEVRTDGNRTLFKAFSPIV